MVTEEAIRQRSYQIWQKEGCPQGRAEEHWRQAKAELEAAEDRALHKAERLDSESYRLLRRHDGSLSPVVPRPQIGRPPMRAVSRRVGRGEPVQPANVATR